MSKKRNNKTQHDWVEKVTDGLEITQDTVLDIPIISLLGKKELCVENFEGILHYGEAIIQLKTQIGILTIKGKKLLAKSMTNEKITIRGGIESLSFVE